MRGSKFILIAAAATVALVGGLAAPAFAATIDVYPGQSIQAAVDKASPGDTIVVHAGVYRESVFVGTPGLTLQGAGATRRGTVLLPPSSTDSPCAESPTSFDGICIAGVDPSTGQPSETPLDGTTVQGFLIQGFPGIGIVAFNTSNTLFQDNAAIDNAAYGITGFANNGITFKNNVAKGSGEAGFYVGDSPHAHALLQNNRASGNLFGFFFRDASEGTASGNWASGNCAGFLILDTPEETDPSHWGLSGNTSSSNDKACPADEEGPPVSGVGMLILGGNANDVENNAVYDNVPSGPSFASGGILVMSSRGFGGSNPVGNLVAFNTARGNSPYDISWDGTGRNAFHQNDCGSSSPGWICP